MITCDRCKTDFTPNVKYIGSTLIEVGFDCPRCHAWYRSFYTNRQLEKRRVQLQKLMDKAKRSDKDWEHYQKQKARFQVAHDALQSKVRQ